MVLFRTALLASIVAVGMTFAYGDIAGAQSSTGDSAPHQGYVVVHGRRIHYSAASYGQLHTRYNATARDVLTGIAASATDKHAKRAVEAAVKEVVKKLIERHIIPPSAR